MLRQRKSTAPPRSRHARPLVSIPQSTLSRVTVRASLADTNPGRPKTYVHHPHTPMPPPYYHWRGLLIPPPPLSHVCINPPPPSSSSCLCQPRLNHLPPSPQHLAFMPHLTPSFSQPPPPSPPPPLPLLLALSLSHQPRPLPARVEPDVRQHLPAAIRAGPGHAATRLWPLGRPRHTERHAQARVERRAPRRDTVVRSVDGIDRRAHISMASPVHRRIDAFTPLQAPMP